MLVVGAGIAGLATTLELGRRGHSVVVVERAPQPRAEGYMIDFFGPGYDAAEAMGLLDSLAAIHYEVESLDFVNPDGTRRLSLPYRKLRAHAFRGRHFNFMRGDLERVLLDAALPHADLRYDATVTTLCPGDDRVSVMLNDGTEAEFDVVVGADGVHSAIREQCFGPQSQFEVPLGHVTAAFLIDKVPDRAPASRFSTVDASGRMVGVYPIRGGRAATFFVHRSDDPARELARGAHDVLPARFGDLDWIVPDLLDQLARATDVYFDSVAQITVDRWSCGRVVLVGDAAWCVSLLAGQGASLALAGAQRLARALDAPRGRAGGYAAHGKPIFVRSSTRASARAVPSRRGSCLNRVCDFVFAT